MTREEEVSNPKSCFNKATRSERMFILLERDPAMVDTIMFWVRERIRLNLNQADDAKLMEAIKLAQAIDNTNHERAEIL